MKTSLPSTISIEALVASAPLVATKSSITIGSKPIRLQACSTTLRCSGKSRAVLLIIAVFIGFLFVPGVLGCREVGGIIAAVEEIGRGIYNPLDQRVVIGFCNPVRVARRCALTLGYFIFTPLA